MKKIISLIIFITLLSSCSKKEIAIPQFDVNDGVVAVSEVLEASYYELSLNENIYQLKGLSFELVNEGEYQLKVRAVKADSNNLIYSNWSEILSYHYQYQSIEVPQIEIDDNYLITFAEIADIDYYELDLNGNLFKLYTNHYQLFDGGYYEIKLRAVKIINNNVIFSDYSNLLEVTILKENSLETPIITQITESLISWGEIVNASSYLLLVNGTLELTSNNYYNLTNQGLNEVKIKAISKDEELYPASLWSQVYEFVLEEDYLGAIVFKSTNMVVSYGEEFSLYQELYPNNDNAIIDYQISNDVITKVADNLFKANQLGISYIKASASNYLDATIKVTVIPKINLDYQNVSINLGETHQIILNVEPLLSADEVITFSSSNNEIVTVSSTGMLYGKKKGIATITIKTTFGVTLTLSVTVR